MIAVETWAWQYFGNFCIFKVKFGDLDLDQGQQNYFQLRASYIPPPCQNIMYVAQVVSEIEKKTYLTE